VLVELLDRGYSKKYKFKSCVKRAKLEKKMWFPFIQGVNAMNRLDF
jgi:hypothetical protein